MMSENQSTHHMPEALLTQHEKTPTTVYDHSHEASIAVAHEIATLIRAKADAGQPCVLGLATGSTPKGVYAELVRMHREEGLSFANVTTFNLDEYYPIDPDDLLSYHHFMNQQLFSHVDIDPANVHIPTGTLPIEEIAEHCVQYEQQIKDAGGIDLQILGIGRTGHIGFNEPGSGPNSRTRLITLDYLTITDAAGDFGGKENVPRRAITMGVGTILQAKRVLLMAFGEGKASVTAKAIEGPMTDVIAASFLQDHPNAQKVLDRAAADHLTRYKAPWKLGPIQWDDATLRRAVIGLALKLSKPLLKLTEEDYNENYLQDLLAEQGPAYQLNLNVFRDMQRTITGWPGGKPEHLKQPGDRDYPSDAIYPKRALIFSPHPDDDVISMGGTLLRLVDHGHDVHVAYQVSGNLAVFDEDVVRFADFATDYTNAFGLAPDQASELNTTINDFLENRQADQPDSDAVRNIKGLIRRGEARAAGRYCGVPMENLHFMDLPFYETGSVTKSPLGEKDIQLVVELLEKIQPHQIYAAGDLSDPHGTHRVCLSAIFQAIERIKDQAWFKDCEVWLYRGAWQEWEPERIDRAVPLSPLELQRKRIAIFKHESQKDKAMFPGTDSREFWQRAEDRNRDTAITYDKLGLPEYEGIEGFVLWDGDSKYM